MPRRSPRSGYTILELLVVITILLILGAVVLPSITGMARDTKGQAAADAVRGHAALARSRAVEDGRAYQLLVWPDGTRLRVAPDESEQPEQPADGTATPALIRETALPPTVTLVPISFGTDQQQTTDANGWIKLATFKPDGTCLEDGVQFELREPGAAALVVNVRGLTGSVTVNTQKQTQQTQPSPAGGAR